MTRAGLLMLVAAIQIVAFVATYGTFFALVPMPVKIVWGANLVCNCVLVGVVFYDGWYFETKRRNDRESQ